MLAATIRKEIAVVARSATVVAKADRDEHWDRALTTSRCTPVIEPALYPVLCTPYFILPCDSISQTQKEMVGISYVYCYLNSQSPGCL